MTSELFVSAVAAGLLGGCTLLMPTLGVALLYGHGRYLPLWLPGLGVGGAYLLHALWTFGMPLGAAAAVVLVSSAGVAIAIHLVFLTRFIDREDYLSPLLVGIGLGEVFEGVASLYGEGMSQHYPTTLMNEAAFSRGLGLAVYWADVVSLTLTAASLATLWVFLNRTRPGLQVRAVMANRDLAGSLGLPVRRVDAFVVAFAAAAMVAGVVTRGGRHDLQPSMMFFPGLTAVVACVVAGPGCRALALLLAIVMEIAVRVVGVVPALSPIQRAIPFVVLLALFAVRGIPRPKTAPLVLA